MEYTTPDFSGMSSYSAALLAFFALAVVLTGACAPSENIGYREIPIPDCHWPIPVDLEFNVLWISQDFRDPVVDLNRFPPRRLTFSSTQYEGEPEYLSNQGLDLRLAQKAEGFRVYVSGIGLDEAGEIHASQPQTMVVVFFDDLPVIVSMSGFSLEETRWMINQCLASRT